MATVSVTESYIEENGQTMTSPPIDRDFLDFCDKNVFKESAATKYIHWFLLPAVGIIVLFCCLERRRTIKPDLFGGRPAPARPLSFLDEPNNRWGIMIAFGAVTGILISVTQKTFSAEFPIWAKIFLVYILCLETSVLCYPMFICMTTRHKLVGAITGLVYSIGWFSFEMFNNVIIGRCYTTFKTRFIEVNLTAHILLQELPITICDFLIVVKFIHKLYKCIQKGVYKTSAEDQNKLCRDFHIKYVKHLVNKNHTDKYPKSKPSLKARFISKFVKPVPGFRYPVSILMVICMTLMLLYIVALYCAEFMEIFSKGTFKRVVIQTQLPFEDFVGLWIAANVIATLVTLLCGIRNIYIFAINYRRDMLSLFRGDRSFIPSIVKVDEPQICMARGMRFIGTAVVGSLWGTVFCYLTVFVPMILTFLVFKFLYYQDKLPQLYKQFQWLIYPLCMIIIFQLQTRLIGRFFIQPRINKGDKLRPLAANNRHWYDIVCFFMLFLNASIGLFTFLKRILIGAIMGLFLIPRMDKCLLMRGYENMDKCYLNYIGMIMVDFAHNNPTMRVFCHTIKDSVEKRRDRAPTHTPVENPIYCTSPKYIPTTINNSRSRKRWLLAYTLVRNPSLISERKPYNIAPVIEPVNPDDIQYEDDSVKEYNSMADRTGSLFINCCKKCSFQIPPNISTNIMAVFVLLMVLLLYVGLPLLVEDLQF